MGNSATNHCVQVARDVMRTLRGKAHTSWEILGGFNGKNPEISWGFHITIVGGPPTDWFVDEGKSLLEMDDFFRLLLFNLHIEMFECMQTEVKWFGKSHWKSQMEILMGNTVRKTPSNAAHHVWWPEGTKSHSDEKIPLTTDIEVTNIYTCHKVRWQSLSRFGQWTS